MISDKNLKLLRILNRSHVPTISPSFMKEVKDNFLYPYKKKLLENHGEVVDYHYQDIKHECWTCGGTGECEWSMEDPICWKCDGTGIYKRKKTVLGLYRIQSKNITEYFHLPADPVTSGLLFGLKNNRGEDFSKVYNGYIPRPYELSQRRFHKLLVCFLARNDPWSLLKQYFKNRVFKKFRILWNYTLWPYWIEIEVCIRKAWASTFHGPDHDNHKHRYDNDLPF